MFYLKLLIVIVGIDFFIVLIFEIVEVRSVVNVKCLPFLVLHAKFVVQVVFDGFPGNFAMNIFEFFTDKGQG